MKPQPHIENANQEVEALLRRYLLSANSENSFSPNINDMTAEIIFTSGATVAPAEKKEKELLARLDKAFNKGGVSGRSIWLLLLLLSFVGFILLRRQMYKPEELVSLHEKTLIDKDSHSWPEKMPPSHDAPLMRLEKITNADLKPGNRGNALPGDTSGRNDHKRQEKQGLDRPPIFSQPGFLPDDGNYPRQAWENFDISWKATPEKYVKKKDSFRLESDGFPYFIEKNRINHEYYVGAPLKKVPDDLIYINYGEQLQQWYVNRYTLSLSHAARFYLDTATTVINQNQQMKINEVPEIVLAQMLNPFYFRKYEVTNDEYRQFLSWTAKHNGFINPAQPWSMHVPADKVKDEFAYTFHYPSSPALKDLPSKTINIFPDTAVISRDFPFCKDDISDGVHINTYSTDPYFGNRPVCGITYWQALAYLDWLTYFYQDYFDKNNIPYKVTFSLPSDIEWEIAASLVYYSYEKDGTKIPPSNYVFDNDWVCSLILSWANTNERSNSGANSLDKWAESDVIYEGDYIMDEYFYPGPANLGPVKNGEINVGAPINLHHDQFGISWMDNNVSEWMQESYRDNWLPMYTRHHNTLLQSDKDPDKIMSLIEDYYNKRNATDGRLVRGGNFYDERFSIIQGKNLAGIMLKRFVSPNEEYATIGFRYVVRIEKK